MEMSGELYVRAAVPREGKMVPTELEAGWAPEPIWVVLYTRITLHLSGIKLQTVQTVANRYIDLCLPNIGS
jgi:hypothetical protein